MKRSICAFLFSVFIFACVGISNASLVSVGGGVYYSGDTNLLWYASVPDDIMYSRNYYVPTPYEFGAYVWARDLSVVVNGVTLNDWRLPVVDATQISGGFTFEGEIEKMLAEIGGGANVNSFFPGVYYDVWPDILWTQTQVSQANPNVWAYPMYALGTYMEAFSGYGNQPYMTALAVHSPDGFIPPSSATPEPSSMLLIGLGASGVALLRRRTARKK